jgi:hypothetical protein
LRMRQRLAVGPNRDVAEGVEAKFERHLLSALIIKFIGFDLKRPKFVDISLQNGHAHTTPRMRRLVSSCLI